jgi:hypothetical protein
MLWAVGFESGGFRTDGASIPRMLWALLGSPFDPRLVEAATYHDAAYRVGMHRGDADELFRLLLLANGVTPARARLLWFGVRVFGWRYWRRCRFGRGMGGQR